MAQQGGDRRPDERIQDEVSERLAAEPGGAMEQVQVDVVDGEVTLAGIVDSPEARRRAEDVAGGVADVVAVVNNLRVRQPGGTGVVG